MIAIDSVVSPEAVAAEAIRRKPYLKIRPRRGWISINVEELWRFRDLMWSLVGRDLKLRYKQTALGVSWVVLQPIIAAGIFSFVFGGLGGMGSGKTIDGRT